MQHRSSFGQFGEELASDWLLKNGYKILQKNYKQRFGEIDIIASKKNLIIFVEVKARKNNYFNLSEVITFSKQKKIILTAKYYIAKNRVENKIIRFDVALIQDNNVTYIENAFTQDNFY